MIEDKLTHAQRVRLEALAQTLAASHVLLRTPSTDLDDVTRIAERLEEWILEAVDRDQQGPPAPAAAAELAHLQLGTAVRTLHRGAVDDEGTEVDAIDYHEGTEVVVTLPRPPYAVARSRAATLLEAALSLVRVIGPGEVGHADVVDPDLLGRLSAALEELTRRPREV